jgi:hypothetical protein
METAGTTVNEIVPRGTVGVVDKRAGSCRCAYR